jgi:hypothetical protein
MGDRKITAWFWRTTGHRSAKTQIVPSGDGHVLPAIDLVGDRSGRDLASEAGLPQQCARASVEGLKVAFPTTDEQHVRRGRQNSAAGDIVHLECPFLVAGLRIERHHDAVRGTLMPRVAGVHTGDLAQTVAERLREPVRRYYSTLSSSRGIHAPPHTHFR